MKRTVLFVVPIVLLVCMLSPPTSGAQTLLASLEPEKIFYLLDETVVTASRYEQPRSEAPATVITINEQTIRERGYRYLVDVLKDLPGFDIQEKIGGQAGGTYVIQRGLWGNNKIQVLKDGIPLNPANGTHLVYGHHLSVRGLKRIEVMYGSASALYGADAFSGIINLITKDVDADRQAEFQVQGGNNDSADGYFLVGARPFSDATFQIYGHGYRTNGFDMRKEYDSYRLDDGWGNLTPFYEPDKPFENPTQDFDITVKATLGEWKLTGMYFHTRQPNNVQTPYYTGRSQLSKDKAEINTYDLHLGHMFQIGKHVKFSSILNWQFYELDPNSDYGRYTFDNYIYERSEAWRWEEQGEYSYGSRNRLIGGFSVERVSTFPYINSRTPFDRGDIYDGCPVDHIVTADGTTIDVEPVEEEHYWIYGAFIQLTHWLLPHTSMSMGVRYDLDTFNHLASVNPRLGIVHELTKDQQIKFMYGTAYISPSVYFQKKRWADGPYVHIPSECLDKKLDSEKVQSFEVSYSVKKELFSFNGSVYFTQARDMIQEAGGRLAGNTVYYKDGRIFDNATLEFPVNSGIQTNIGVDLSGNILLGRHWSAYLNYSFINSRIHLNHHEYDAPKISTHKAGFGFTGLLWDHLSLHIRGHWWSGIHTQSSNPLYRGGKIKGQMIFDANVRWINLLPGLDMVLTINNLFDEKYFTAGSESEDHTTGASLPLVPQNPREILLGISYRF